MQKKLIIAAVAFLLLALGGVFALSSIIHGDVLKKQIVDSFKSATGLELEIQGNAEVHILPFPHLLVNALYVPNSPGAANPFLLSIKGLEGHISMASILKGKPTLDKIYTKGVNLNIERLHNGMINWRERVQAASASGEYKLSSFSLFSLAALSVADGEMTFTDTQSRTSHEVKNINFQFTGGGVQLSTIAATLRYIDMPLSITGQVGNISLSDANAVPLKLHMQSGNTVLNYDGETGIRDNGYYLKGGMMLATDDIGAWAGSLLGDKRSASESSVFTPLPLQARGNLAVHDGKLVLSDMAIDGPVMKGMLQTTFTSPSRLDVSANIDLLDGELLCASRLVGMQIKDAVRIKENPLNAPESILPAPTFLESLTIGVNLQLNDIIYNHQHIHDTRLAFDYAGDDMTISQATALLPGESRVVFTGLGKDTSQGFDLEGQIDAAGADFSSMIKVLKPKGFAIPVEDFKRFRIKTNALITGKSAQFSQIAARIENMGFLGGIVANYSGRPQIHAVLRIGGVNLDHLITLWGLEQWQSSFMNENLGTKSDDLISQWLKLLGYDLELDASLEQYTLNGKLRDPGEFRMMATQGKIAFDYFKGSYNGSELSGKASLNVMEPMPRVTLDLIADTLDSSFLGFNKKPDTPPQADAKSEHWSHNGFDFHWLDLFNATYHLQIGRFNNDILSADSIDMQGGVESGALSVDTFTALLAGAQVNSKIALMGGRIPSLRIVSDITDLDIGKLATAFPALSGLTGKYNLNFHLDTSGIDMFSWASNLQGAIGMGARNVIIHGFNLLSIIQSVSYVRSTSDILDAVRHAFPGGQTVFNSVSGQWTVSNGVLRTANMKLINPQAEAFLNGEIDIVNWKVRNQVVFALKSLDPQHPPTISFNIMGDLDDPQKSLDTTALEQYVTDVTSQKMLEQYGNH